MERLVESPVGWACEGKEELASTVEMRANPGHDSGRKFAESQGRFWLAGMCECWECSVALPIIVLLLQVVPRGL